MRSLRLRLLLGAVVGVSAALAVAGVILVTIFESHVRQRYVKELDDHLLQLAAIVQVDEAGLVTLKHELSDPAFQRPLSGLYWQVKDGGRVVLRSRSLWDEALALPSAGRPGELQERELSGPRKQRLIAVERRCSSRLAANILFSWRSPASAVLSTRPGVSSPRSLDCPWWFLHRCSPRPHGCRSVPASPRLRHCANS